MHTVDIRQLRVLVTLMAEANVSRASDRLGVSQPSLSQTLARLRTAFGDPLLIRSGRGMVPTDRAREIERSARALIADYDRLVAPPLPFDPGTSERRFVLTAPEYAEHLLMPPLLARLRADAPGVRIDVRAPQPERAVEILESGEVDVRIAWVLSPPGTLRSMALFQDRLVCLASRSHSRIRGALQLAEFLQSAHIRPNSTARPTSARVLDDALERVGAKIDTFLVQNFLTIPSILAGTDMLATLPARLAETFTAQHNLQVFELPVRVPRIRYAAYWHERSHRDAGHRWLREQLRAAARTLS